MSLLLPKDVRAAGTRTPTLLVNHDPARWVPALRAAAPALQLCTSADGGDPRDIDAMLTWRLDPELIERSPTCGY